MGIGCPWRSGTRALVGTAAILSFGVAGAAMTVDGLALAALAAHLQTSSSQIVFDRREALLTALRTVLAAAAMAAVLLAAGHGARVDRRMGGGVSRRRRGIRRSAARHGRDLTGS